MNAVSIWAMADKSILVLMVVLAAPAIAGIAIAGRKRELEHKERMRALEMGLSLEPSRPWAAWAAIAIGGVVPVAALVVGLLATLLAPKQDFSDPESIVLASKGFEAYYGITWGCVSMVGLAGVIAGAFLANRLIAQRGAGLDASPHHGAFAAKPTFEPDTFDTVSRRG